MENPILQSTRSRNQTTPPRRLKNCLVLMIGAMSWLGASASAQDGAAIFNQRCAVCHSIGQGRLAGPDLKDVQTRRTEAWLMQFIKSAQATINSGDANAKALFDEYKIAMPDQNIPDSEIKAVLAHIASRSSAGAAATSGENEPQKSAAQATEADIQAGQALFTGARRFSAGGAACITCHAINHPAATYGGGRLAAELTASYAGMGDGLMGLLASPPFPPMAAAYNNRPLNEKEIFRVTAFLKHAGETKPGQAAASNTRYFAFGGSLGLIAVLGGLNVIWFRRKNLSTKHAILERQTKSI